MTVEMLNNYHSDTQGQHLAFCCGGVLVELSPHIETVQAVLNAAASALSGTLATTFQGPLAGLAPEGHHLSDVLQGVTRISHVLQTQQAPLVVIQEIGNQRLLKFRWNLWALTDTHIRSTSPTSPQHQPCTPVSPSPHWECLLRGAWSSTAPESEP